MSVTWPGILIWMAVTVGCIGSDMMKRRLRRDGDCELAGDWKTKVTVTTTAQGTIVTWYLAPTADYGYVSYEVQIAGLGSLSRPRMEDQLHAEIVSIGSIEKGATTANQTFPLVCQKEYSQFPYYQAWVTPLVNGDWCRSCKNHYQRNCRASKSDPYPSVDCTSSPLPGSTLSENSSISSTRIPPETSSISSTRIPSESSSISSTWIPSESSRISSSWILPDQPSGDTEVPVINIATIIGIVGGLLAGFLIAAIFLILVHVIYSRTTIGSKNIEVHEENGCGLYHLETNFGGLPRGSRNIEVHEENGCGLYHLETNFGGLPRDQDGKVRDNTYDKPFDGDKHLVRRKPEDGQSVIDRLMINDSLFQSQGHPKFVTPDDMFPSTHSKFITPDDLSLVSKTNSEMIQWVNQGSRGEPSFPKPHFRTTPDAIWYTANESQPQLQNHGSLPPCDCVCIGQVDEPYNFLSGDNDSVIAYSV